MTDQADNTLLQAIAAYCAEHGLSPSRFGLLMMGDPRLVHDIRRGRELRRETRARLKARMQYSAAVRAGLAPNGDAQ